jgi:UDP-2,3-diacylglucosamine pyrophosphatase LpxH
MKTEKRWIDVVVISDVHLGTYGCHATELSEYLQTIQPRLLILNGDIIDGWAFSKSYWPLSHHKVLGQILKMAASGTTVYYLTGNHDEMLRRFSDFNLGNFHLADKMILELDGKKAWIFHGDIFDLSINSGKWLAKIAGKSYDYLILFNRFINWCMEKTGREKVSLSKNIKNSVKKAVKFIADFEEVAASHAIEQGYDYVICGHIHQPQNRIIETENGKVVYLNSGDWIENLTALEYNQGAWSFYQHKFEKQTTNLEKKRLKTQKLNIAITYNEEVNLIFNTI